MSEIKFIYSFYSLYFDFNNSIRPILNSIDVKWSLDEVIKDYFDLCITRVCDYIYYIIEDPGILTLLNPYLNNVNTLNQCYSDMFFEDFYMYTYESAYFCDSQLDDSNVDTNISHLCILTINSILKEVMYNACHFDEIHNFFHTGAISQYETINKLNIKPFQYTSDALIEIGLS